MINKSNKKIKICHIVTRLDWAGVSDILRIICQDMVENYEFTLVSGPTKFPTIKTKQFLDQFTGKVVVISCLQREISLLKDLRALWQLYRFLRINKFDLVHTHTAKAGFLGRVAAWFAGVKIIIHMPHGHNFYGYFSNLLSGFIIFLEKIAGLIKGKIIVFTELEKKDYLRFKIKPAQDIMVVPSGLEIGDFEKIDNCLREKKRVEFGVAQGQRVVGMVSRLEVVKGPQYFIEAACQIAGQMNDVKFFVIGDGELKESLELIVERRGLKEKIKFLGWREDVLAIISIFDILVQPSLNEAVGRVLLEAQMLGVVVVAAGVGGIPEIVRDGITGIIVPPKDKDALVKAISCLLHDSLDRSNKAQAATVWARENFSSRVMIRKIQDIYEQEINDKKN